MKRLSILSILMLLMFAAWAQNPGVVGFAVGGGIDAATGSEAIIGQPFSEFVKTADYSVTLGIGQSQLSLRNVTASINEGESYSQYGFNYPSTTPSGTYTDSRYDLFGGDYNYDLLTTLNLTVLATAVDPCGGEVTVYDGDHNPYNTVAVAGYCWTRENLIAEHYASDGSALTEAAKVYSSLTFPNESENLATYGRLYTWYAAVNLPAGSTSAPVAVGGYVQGVCPNGWHIPTVVEKNALLSLSALDLRTHEWWITPNSNTNSTNFTSLPAGKYNAALGQFEGMTLETDFWYDASDAGTSGSTIVVPALCYWCDQPQELTHQASDGLSVRCVKNH